MLNNKITIIKQNKKFHLGNIQSDMIIILTGLLIYSNTINGPFIFDDLGSIVKNPAIKHLFGFKNIWLSAPRRFITYFSFALNYSIGGINPFGYHLVNIFIHISCALILKRFVNALFYLRSLREEVYHSIYISFFAALIFLVHPVQTQAVTYVCQRAAILSTLFYIFSLYSYLIFRTSEVGESKSAIKWYIFALISAVFGINSKETFFTIPLSIILLEVFFIEANPKKYWLRVLPFFIIILILPVNLMLEMSVNISNISQLTKESATITRMDYLITQFRVITTYIRILFAPYRLHLDYYFTISKSLFNPMTGFYALLFLLSIVTSGVALFFKHRLMSFCIFLFFILLSIESSIIPITDVIFEHRLYLPMLAFSVFISQALFTLLGSQDQKKI